MKEVPESQETEKMEAESHPKKFLKGALAAKEKIGKKEGKKKKGMKR